MQAEVLDEAQHRIVLEPLRRRQAELRDVRPARVLVHRKRRERHEREREVDREDGDRHEPDRAGDRPPRIASLLGKVRHRLDPRIGDHRHGNRQREVRPRRRDPPVDVLLQHVGAEHEGEPEPDEHELRREVDHREPDVERGRLLDPDDVDPDEDDDDDDPADDVPRVRLQRRPEDREVVRHEERRDRDRDDVVEHLRPRSHEGDELVERTPREARRPARLGEENGPLGVGRGRAGEDQPRDDEDERCEPERNRRGDAERVVDRRADVPVRGREESRRSQHALERMRLPPPSWHRLNLLRPGVDAIEPTHLFQIARFSLSVPEVSRRRLGGSREAFPPNPAVTSGC